MVYCTHCGTKNKADANFYIKCGAKLNISTEASLEKHISEFARHRKRSCFA